MSYLLYFNPDPLTHATTTFQGLPTHEALGEMVGTYRETITKTLNEFRAAGMIELRRGKVIILDGEELSRFSQS